MTIVTHQNELDRLRIELKRNITEICHLQEKMDGIEKNIFTYLKREKELLSLIDTYM